jgi:hypothetical protein
MPEWEHSSGRATKFRVIYNVIHNALILVLKYLFLEMPNHESFSLRTSPVSGTSRETTCVCWRGKLFSNSSVWPRGDSVSMVCLMPEPVITVILLIYRRYIKKRWWGLFLTRLGFARSKCGAGKESQCVRGVICFRILLYSCWSGISSRN